MIFSIIHIIMLLGAVQGIIFSGFAFFSKKYKSRSNFFLGMLILAFSYNIIQNYMVASNLFSLDQYFEIFYIPLSSVFLVLFYLYVSFFLNQKRKLLETDYLLFIPFLIALIAAFIEKTGFLFHWFDQTDTTYFNYYRIAHESFNVVFSFILILASYRLILKTEQKQSYHSKVIPKIRLKWLKTITLILLCLCIYWVVPLYFEFQMKIDTALLYFYVLWIGLALAIYILGHIGIYQFGVYEEQKNIQKFAVSVSSAITSETTSSKNHHIIAFENFIATKKNYLDSNLSLDGVAQELNLNKSHLSRIINTELGKSFSDYVNQLRVEEAKAYMANPEFSNYTLVAIGLEAGFNSKSTFHTTFKKYTGMTPSEYKNTIHKNA